MSYGLFGPFVLDLEDPAAGARAALDWARAGGAERSAPVTDVTPGLYLLYRLKPRALVGLWVVAGPGYVAGGPAGAPERAPPLADPLLGAAIEAVWWRSLAVHPVVEGEWRPLVVIELPPSLAERAALYPPGVRPARFDQTDEVTSAGGWLDEPADLRGDPRREAVVEPDEGDEPGLPPRRSLITIIRGALWQEGELQRGRFALVAPERLSAGGPAPLERWIEAASSQPATPSRAERFEVGPALLLPGARVGYALPGWLTRDLAPWPPSPRELQEGQLRDRDVGGVWARQVRVALGLTFAVLGLVLAVAGVVWFASQPRVRTAPSVAAPAAQPALSVCSADHEAFVARLRCQVDWLAGGGEPGGASCEGPGGAEELQSAFCGLADRAEDGVGWKGMDYADLAASQACFEVLGRPWPYALSGSDRRLGDPALLLDDPNLHIEGLSALVSELKGACADARARLEARLDGAVLATHIGAADDGAGGEAAELRAMSLSYLLANLPPERQSCLSAGAIEGVTPARRYRDLCGGGEGSSKAWAALDGEARPDLIGRYVRSRFGALRSAAAAPRLWACHGALAEGQIAGVAPAAWDLNLPVPASYSPDGAVQSQLVLDAGLRALAGGLDAGPCWATLADQLALYPPAWPLLGSVEQPWPSVEQQVCGQACAVRYRLVTSVTPQVTPGADLALCLDHAPPSASPDLGRGALDRLRLPWNGGDREGWMTPTDAQICAFNLIGQGWLDGGTLPLLADGATTPLWAGETGAGSRIAGGTDGLAARAAMDLSRFGRSRSSTTCNFAATQCLVEEMLGVTGDPRLEPYQWLDRWRRRVGEIAAGGSASPWCDRVRDYLSPSGELPEGELDYPCASGVDLARQAVDARVSALARQSQLPQERR